ncbi:MULTISPECIES: endonuclease domain-containing protein [Streptomyces]|uniref:endonuclease domain-containing protein n=1 Tax=Streptomyces TaxID=1883 RepID=UPI00103D2BBE|nr:MULTISPECIES: endonuclease domain-containing protein [Streptomyces]MBT3077671.1 endonuclease VII domain-containing protein [Streptomyces sp. COG21]MBT3084516.1 endonuclease VII domain-containing protein [Streptomyces sp. COG20]MBT3085422.1 endonuclease VII domain-containing protein [Streptomyces sp. CYG21]MBT3099016.1 endonuclease VII domain-containing protein [Streptomyces sp. CBG30]MBT3103535.1 endonuclease VII domain-containing protein [Streptomyces sp. COG19]
MGEVRRQGDVERKWLGDATQNRPSFAEAEILDRQGVPSCHTWKVPPGEVPQHLSATQALRRWQAGACAMCSARPERLLVDHCHQSGLVRGLLCTSCNTAEGLQDAPPFVAYRSRPPAVLLGVEEQYGSAWDGFAQTPTGESERSAKHVDAAEALFGDITSRFRTTS